MSLTDLHARRGGKGRTWSRAPGKWANGHTAARDSAWHHEAWADRRDVQRREPSMSERASVAVCVGLAGANPDRVERMRAGFSGDGYAR